jgi:replicative DNA helicase
MTTDLIADLIAAIIAAHANGGITKELVDESRDVDDIITFSEALKATNAEAYAALITARRDNPVDDSWVMKEDRRITAEATPENNAAFDELVAEASGWPEPTALIERPDLPTWPVEVLPAWMANHITSSADQLQVPIDLCAQFALGALSAAAMGHGRVVLGGRWSEPLNLYLATALHSGGGKSPAEKRMTKPLRRWEHERREASMSAVADATMTHRILEKRLKMAEQSAAVKSEPIAVALEAQAALLEHEIPTPYRLLADDATPEALVQILGRHGGRLAVLSTEAELLDMAAGAYSGDRPVNVGVYLKAYSGDTIMVDRKGGSAGATELRIDEPLLTVGLAMQPTVIDFIGARNSQLEGRGFLARFLYAYPESLVGTRDRWRVIAKTDDRADAEAYDIALVAFAERCAASTDERMTLSEDAERTFVGYLQDHEPQMGPNGRLRPVAEWMAKLQSGVLRVAGLLHLADGHGADQPIDVATVERAMVAGNYWIEHALSMAVRDDDTQAASDAEVVWKVIERKGLERTTPREIWLGIRSRFRSVMDLVPALQRLEACGYLRLTAGTWLDVGVQAKPVRIECRLTVREIVENLVTERSETRGTRVTVMDVGFESTPSLSHSLSSYPTRDTRVPRVLDDAAEDAEPVDNPNKETSCRTSPSVDSAPTTSSGSSTDSTHTARTASHGSGTDTPQTASHVDDDSSPAMASSADTSTVSGTPHAPPASETDDPDWYQKHFG